MQYGVSAEVDFEDFWSTDPSDFFRSLHLRRLAWRISLQICRPSWRCGFQRMEDELLISYGTKRDSTTKLPRFHNQNLRIPQPNSHDSTTKTSGFHNQNLRIPQPNSHDSTTKTSGFHNQNLRIPQPNSHDSTTKTSGFHNQNLAILQLTTIDSTRKTAATYFHCRKILTSYKKLKSPTPAKQ